MDDRHDTDGGRTDDEYPRRKGRPMTPDVDAETWGRLFDRLDDEAPPALEVAERLADALDLSVADAQAAVYDAIDADLLEEDG
ncbi:hypothetical protein ACFQJD_00205, partial [Haloplanus sp. GCM10025708]|uniref:hypothetical protein n=1 Tax=Haloplanus sp. GCM10025708 TaxID=3252679 RepID=UPI00360BB2EC